MPSPNSQPPNSNPGHKYSGFLNLNKPTGWTSHDCVAKVRRLLGMKKVGHAGTLDPAATGVLPIALGKATRLLQYLPSDKAYRAVIRFGVTTDTDDLDGQIRSQQPVPHLTLNQIQACLPQFIGEIKQIPPRYSAIQVNGQRLYDLARQGKAVDVPERTVTVHSLQVTDWQPGDYPELSLDVACGAGTYIRSIARDLGEAIGTGATLATLKRTKSSGFTLAESFSLAAITQQLEENTFNPLPPEAGLQILPEVQLNKDETIYWCQGRKPLLETSSPSITADRIVRVVGPDHLFLGIGDLRTDESATVLAHRVVYAQPW
ncbi:MAG: tRNA pseudouridine(55) synthase TruB [Cyanobacteria bacterium J06632_22]